MLVHLMRPGRRLAAWLLLILLLCAANAAAQARDWPREFRNADGSVTRIPEPPKRILSTTVTATGTLLAIDAPVAASAASASGKFFAQWQVVAQERGVSRLWPAGNVDVEAAFAAAPDLIVVSATGADSARDQIALLQTVAPVVMIDYSGQTWQDLARQLGRATGLEQRAEQRIADFDSHVAQARQHMRLPAGQVNLISFNGPGASNPIARVQGVHGRLLAALGFDVEGPDPQWHGGVGEPGDFVWAPYEALTQLQASTTFLLRGGEERVQALQRDPVLANLPSVRAGQVYSLGPNSFRIDYYSAMEIVDDLFRRYGR